MLSNVRPIRLSNVCTNKYMQMSVKFYLQNILSTFYLNRTASAKVVLSGGGTGHQVLFPTELLECLTGRRLF